MSELKQKPLKWEPDPEVGFTVIRRADGGMHVTFNQIDVLTLEKWREFALAHLLDSDRLTHNLYDLRQIEEIPEDAIQYALEANSDPSARNIRLAVVVSNEKVRRNVQKVADLTPYGGVELRIFTSVEDAEDWLDRPINLL